ncbi:hypothetical protein NDU88_001461 [Pleurodeles waltl]|uniref:Uncharacterized protein n=1 Tax=Pleurodeles waltl TaxID=8319 RepID=A0AAV7UA94_PLEWA|nr:hypothetical protein NDU88_001461 [Pleurodeles waltl]
MLSHVCAQERVMLKRCTHKNFESSFERDLRAAWITVVDPRGMQLGCILHQWPNPIRPYCSGCGLRLTKNPNWTKLLVASCCKVK